MLVARELAILMWMKDDSPVIRRPKAGIEQRSLVGSYLCSMDRVEYSLPKIIFAGIVTKAPT